MHIGWIDPLCAPSRSFLLIALTCIERCLFETPSSSPGWLTSLSSNNPLYPKASPKNLTSSTVQHSKIVNIHTICSVLWISLSHFYSFCIWHGTPFHLGAKKGFTNLGSFDMGQQKTNRVLQSAERGEKCQAKIGGWIRSSDMDVFGAFFFWLEGPEIGSVRENGSEDPNM